MVTNHPEPTYQATKPNPATLQIIGIAGASGSGKSYLASRVAATLEAPVLSVDAYYRDLSHLPVEERGSQNFDHPQSIDWPLLLEHLQALLQGEEVEVPGYNFSTHTRSREIHRLKPGGYLVLEGILALHLPRVRELLALSVFVDLDEDECLKRRMDRDIRERGRTPECVLRQYQTTVLPMYREFVQPTAELAHLRVSGGAPVEDAVASVLRELEHHSGL